MDHSVSTAAAQSKWHPRNPIHIANSIDSNSVQAGLFEQILSLPTNFEPVHPRESDETVPHASTDEPPDNSPASRSDDSPSPDESPSEAVEDSEPSADGIALATPAIAPETAEQGAPKNPEAPLAGSSSAAESTDDQPREQSSEHPRSADENPDIANVEADHEPTVTGSQLSSHQTEKPEHTTEAVNPTSEQITPNEKPPESDGEASRDRKRLPAEVVDSTNSAEIDTTADSVTNDSPQEIPEPTAEDQELTDEQSKQIEERRPAKSKPNQQREKWYESEALDVGQTPADKQATTAIPTAAQESPTQANSSTASPQVMPEAGVTPSVPELQNPTTVHNIVPSGIDTQVASKTTVNSGEDSSNVRALGAGGERSGRPLSRDDETAQRVAARKNQAPSNSDEIQSHDRLRLIQRISRSFSRLGPTGGQINLKLHPPQLGSLNVQVRLQGKDMAAKLTTENAAAREVLLENLPLLRGRLAEQGFEVSQFQVDVADNNSNATAGHQQQDSFQHQEGGLPNRHDHATRRSTVSRESQEAPEANTASPTATWYVSSGIDLHA